MNDVIVTIGRENGSGGREVGSILAEMMGVKCYDRTLIEETADRAGVSVEDVRSSEERRGRGHLYFGDIPAPNPLFRSQSEVILDLASKGPCVFVGRCADYVLRDRDDVVNVFITASMEDRIRRSAKRNGMFIREREPSSTTARNKVLRSNSAYRASQRSIARFSIASTPPMDLIHFNVSPTAKILIHGGVLNIEPLSTCVWYFNIVGILRSATTCSR